MIREKDGGFSGLLGGAPLPNAPFPVLPLRSGVVFPGSTLSVSVGRAKSLALIGELHQGDVIAVVSQKDPKQVDPALSDVSTIGSFVRVMKMERQNPQVWRLVLEGLGRFRLESLDSTEPYWRGRGEVIVATGADDPEAELRAEALRRELVATVKDGGGALDQVPAIDGDPGAFADRVAAGLMLDTDEALEILSETDVVQRLQRVTERLARLRAFSELKGKIEGQVREQFGKRQREAILREQLSAIRRELGETTGDGDDDGEDDVSRLKKRLILAKLPEDVQKVADRELRRLEGAAQGPEGGVIRNYLEWIADLPWSKRAETVADIAPIAAKLEADHWGLEDVKKRILEHMAVHKLSGNARGTILCLVGPPGVGKTSLGQSIAAATNRPFVRIALGGARDEAEIRGHRRTYVGALPGRIIQAMKKAGSRNPVLVLDEVDKMGVDLRGDPAAALLEVLDPEQNDSFVDHYIDVPYDLSEVMFLATANYRGNIPEALRDRMETIEVPGYTRNEKRCIAQQFLVPKQLKEHALSAEQLSFLPDGIDCIIDHYTREPGVRNLERELAAICRSAAVRLAEGQEVKGLCADHSLVEELLGPHKHRPELAERKLAPGVATGLALTYSGGDLLLIEATRMPGKGEIHLTGSMRNVMKESAETAVSYVRSRAESLMLDPEWLRSIDLHLHVPRGGVARDAASAGVAMFVAVTTLLLETPARADAAVIGEITLRGNILPVSGIKDKVLAAHRAGITTLILPVRNERDLEEVPDEVKNEIEFHFVHRVDEVLPLVLAPPERAESPSGRPTPIGEAHP